MVFQTPDRSVVRLFSEMKTACNFCYRLKNWTQYTPCSHFCQVFAGKSVLCLPLFSEKDENGLAKHVNWKRKNYKMVTCGGKKRPRTLAGGTGPFSAVFAEIPAPPGQSSEAQPAHGGLDAALAAVDGDGLVRQADLELQFRLGQRAARRAQRAEGHGRAREHGGERRPVKEIRSPPGRGRPQCCGGLFSGGKVCKSFAGPLDIRGGCAMMNVI